MRYETFVEFYETASSELDMAERVEGFLIEKHPRHPSTRGEYVLSSIMHLREAVQQLDSGIPQISKGLDKLEGRYNSLIERDKNLHLRLMKNFKASLATTGSLLARAEKEYFFFRGEFSEGYTYEEYLKDNLLQLEQTAERLHDTNAFPILSINIDVVRTGLERVLQRDIEFHKTAAGFPN
ncbi:MAG: hypothetical protein AABX49_00980 [Nanoarchaeota archaeon]